ncbi:MAG TPA: GntR family transcriptional regulator [Gemmatirosa sp.]
MPQPRRQGITDALRQRLLGALASGALRDGARLPSTRELARDLKADPRVVAEAYRVLAGEGLVELRPRSGVFLATRQTAGMTPTPQGASPQWLAEVVSDGIRRGVPAPAIVDAFTAATRTRSLSAAIIAATTDQAAGLARELRDDFGVQAAGVIVEDLPTTIRDHHDLPRVISRAHFIVGTEATDPHVRRLADRLGIPHVIIDMRPDLLSPDWRLLLTRVTYAVIADARFGALVHAFVDGAEGARNLRVLIAGQDDLSVIPPDAPTYITEAARERIGRHRLPGRLVLPARTLSDASTRAIALTVVHAQLAPARGRGARRAAATAAR